MTEQNKKIIISLSLILLFLVVLLVVKSDKEKVTFASPLSDCANHGHTLGYRGETFLFAVGDQFLLHGPSRITFNLDSGERIDINGSWKLVHYLEVPDGNKN